MLSVNILALPSGGKLFVLNLSFDRRVDFLCMHVGHIHLFYYFFVDVPKKKKTKKIATKRGYA